MAAGTPRPDIERRIVEELQGFKDGEWTRETQILTEVGIDSLDYASMVLGLEEELCVQLQEAQIDWGDVRTVADLAEVFEVHAAPATT